MLQDQLMLLGNYKQHKCKSGALRNPRSWRCNEEGVMSWSYQFHRGNGIARLLSAGHLHAVLVGRDTQEMMRSSRRETAGYVGHENAVLWGTIAWWVDR